MHHHVAEELGKLVASLKGLECWYVSCGGAAASTFQLALGKKLRRARPLKNTAHPEEFRQFEGEAGLYVWCAWRLDGVDSPLTSWDDTQESMQAGLTKLTGARISAVVSIPPAWDLNIEFSNALCLRIFCDHVPGDPSFDGNWDLTRGDKAIAVGPGAKFRIDERAAIKQRN
jgi:hypothetical protein